METFSALQALCAGNSPVPGEFPAQRPVTRSFNVFFDLHLNERLSKQSWGWWFETPSCSLWRHCNGYHHKLLWPSLLSASTYSINRELGEGTSLPCAAVTNKKTTPPGQKLVKINPASLSTLNAPKYHHLLFKGGVRTSWGYFDRDIYIMLVPLPESFLHLAPRWRATSWINPDQDPNRESLGHTAWIYSARNTLTEILHWDTIFYQRILPYNCT